MESSFSNSTTEASSLIKEVPLSHVLFSRDVREASSTKSKLGTECVNYACLVCVDEL